jgi:hypothetical protein
MEVTDDPTSPAARVSRSRASLLSALDRLSTVRPRLLFLVALALHVWAVAVRRAPETYTENLRAGFTLAQKGYLGDPFVVPTGPTGHLSPAYPAVVAAAYAVTGDERGARTVLSLLCAAVASLAAALLVPLARALRLPPGSGALAALFWAVPVFAMLELSAEHETVFSTAVVLLALIAVAHRMAAPDLAARHGALLGTVTGVGAHFTPLVLPMMLFATVGGVLSRRPRRRVRPAFVVAFAAALIVVVTPYTVRNWRVMGTPFFIRDNLGLEIAVSNADDARVTSEANLDAGAAMETHPFISSAAAIRLRNEGEVAYNRRRLREGLAWIWSHPSHFLGMTSSRARLLLVPWSNRPYQREIVALISLGFLTGLVLLWRSGNRTAAAVLGGAVLGYDAIYVFVQHDMRYVYPMLRVESLVAATTVLTVAIRWGRGGLVSEPADAPEIAEQPIAV